ncbi:Hypothetical protein NTJ_10843 [Nesidiocoris tenuis]|uniref:Gustatory receptor n=1 Tax=Nesidiocoris tenuis TaxID=355587 RepID=A0ABN7B1B4_9HEMI|nr:Hypothetical protein NTJ_10843 [Nesidiocoris tenuis]
MGGSKFVEVMLKCSEIFGLWPSWNKNRHFFVVLAMIVNILDALPKAYYFCNMERPNMTISGKFLEIMRNSVSKAVLIIHAYHVVYRRRDFAILNRLLKEPKFKNINYRIFVCGISPFFWRVAMILWLDIKCGVYLDLMVTLSFTFFNSLEFLIAVQFCASLVVISDLLAKIVDSMDLQIFEFELFDKTVALCEKIDNLYGLQLLLITSQIFMMLVTYSLGVVVTFWCISCSEYTYRCPDSTNLLIGYALSNITCVIYLLTMIVKCCYSTMYQVKLKSE